MGHKYGIGDVVYSTIWNEDVRITKLNDNLFYTVRSINRYDWMMTHEGNLKSREDVIEKMMQEHQDVCDEILTIQDIDTSEFEMIEGLVEEEVDLIPKFGEYSDNEPLDIPTMTTEFVKEHGLPCPNSYIFKDENGNVINATKIVLEKKKKEYPKTYEECCGILGLLNVDLCFNADYRSFDASKEQWKRLGLMNQFYQLLICRDAYWKIAGDEMGLDKPWSPDYFEESYEQGCPVKYVIYYTGTHITKERKCTPSYILCFPSAEMRDAFYENFKELINECKALL